MRPGPPGRVRSGMNSNAPSQATTFTATGATPRLVVRQAAVLGAGVMGAQIAAHLVNAGVRVLLFDLPSKEGDASAIARKGVAGLMRLEPAPLGHPDLAASIAVANYADDLARLRDCD